MEQDAAQAVTGARDFSGASWRLKLKRAQKHCDELEKTVLAYIQSEPWKVERLHWENRFMWRWALRITPPDPDFAVIGGDVVHNLRSALDHLAVALVRKPTWDTCFPVESLRLWDTDEEGAPFINNSEALAGFERATRGMHPGAVDIIRLCQPGTAHFHPDKHPLGILSRLDNADKHRNLIAVVTGMNSVTTRIMLRGRYLGGWYARGFCSDGDVVAEHAFAPKEVPPDDTPTGIQMQGMPIVSWEFRVASGKTQTVSAVHTLKRMIEQLPGQIIEPLEKFIPE